MLDPAGDDRGAAGGVISSDGGGIRFAPIEGNHLVGHAMTAHVLGEEAASRPLISLFDPPDACEDDVLHEMGSCEADHYRSSFERWQSRQNALGVSTVTPR